MEQLTDIKAKSIVEWIAHDRVRRTIVKHFRQFLMTYVDEHGASVYGQRIRNLGESELLLCLVNHEAEYLHKTTLNLWKCLITIFLPPNRSLHISSSTLPLQCLKSLTRSHLLRFSSTTRHIGAFTQKYMFGSPIFLSSLLSAT